MTMANIDPAHRLNGEETETWRNLWSFYLGLPAQLDAHLKQDAGISHFDFCAIHRLAASPAGSVRMSGLAQDTGLTLSHLSRVITRLEKRGLVRRLPDPSDGRSTLVELTGAGWSLHEELSPVNVAEIRRLVFDNLSPEESRVMGSALRKMVAAMNGCGRDGAGAVDATDAEAV